MAPHVAKRSTSAKSMLGPLLSWKQSACRPSSCPPDFLYDLYAVCNHHGSLQSGHYTAYCRNSLDGQWYCYDDSMVENLREDEVNTQKAYILFYQKRNSIPPWSASSLMEGSTCPSLSEHWLLRLGVNNNSTRESLQSWNSALGSPKSHLPESPFLTNHLNQKKKGLESRLQVQRIGGRSVSLKATTSSQGMQRTFKTMPCHWSFGPTQKPLGTSVELVDYLKTRRRPQSTSQSVVSLFSSTADKNEKLTMLRSNLANLAKDDKDGERTNPCLLTEVPQFLGNPSHCAKNSDCPDASRKSKESSSQDIRLPNQFGLALLVMPSVQNEKHSHLEDQKTLNCQRSTNRAPYSKEDLQFMELSRKDACSHRHSLAKLRTKTDGRDWETNRFPQGTFTFIKSVFRKRRTRRMT